MVPSSLPRRELRREGDKGETVPSTFPPGLVEEGLSLINLN